MATSVVKGPWWDQIKDAFDPNPTHPSGPAAPDSPAPPNPTKQGPAHPATGSPAGPAAPTGPFNYEADPTYRQISTLYGAQSAAEKLAMDAAIARAKGYYGTESDPLSIFGRLKEGYTIRDRSLQNALNSRGMWRSGETGYGLGQSRLGYLRDELDYKMKLEDYVNGLLSGFARSEQERKLSLVDWAWKLAQAQAAGAPLPPSGGGGTTPPVTPPPQSGHAPPQAGHWVPNPHVLNYAKGLHPPGSGGGSGAHKPQ